MGLLMGKFRQFLTELSAHNRSVFSFLYDNFSKYQWIFTKLDVYIDIVEICFGLLKGKFCLFLTKLAASHMSVV